MASLTDIWPLSGLRLRTGDLELRFHRWPPVEIEGLDEDCLSMFGLPPAA
ncbi:MAG: hypothetical protein M3Y36_02405 [Actinomycetota bacterium]|nr:hypothetical protein [Actinomycetota bacterium]